MRSGARGGARRGGARSSGACVRDGAWPAARSRTGPAAAPPEGGKPSGGVLGKRLVAFGLRGGGSGGLLEFVPTSPRPPDKHAGLGTAPHVDRAISGKPSELAIRNGEPP